MKKLYLQKAEHHHLRLLYKWKNDPVVRANSFDDKKIKYFNHKNWFANILNDPLVDLFICYLDSTPIGQVRLNYLDDVALISYSISKTHRGKGYGQVILKLAVGEAEKKYPKINVIEGNVKLGNIASQIIFEKLGFKKNIVKEGGMEFYKYSKSIV